MTKDVRALKGESFRGWQLLDVLGAGGSAIVYSAEQGEKRAAIKLFFPEALKKHGFSEELNRLELQLQLCGKKQHPHLVEIFDGGKGDELDGTLFLIMEQVPGIPLDQVIESIPRDRIWPLISQLAKAAKFLEDRNLAHRDIKPENIIVSDDFAHLTLLDLGVVKNISDEDETRLSGKRFVSTPRYSPPEFVWRDEDESPEAWRAITFYQIGATLHDMIMRRRIFVGNDEPPARLYDAIRIVPPDIRAEDCDPTLIFLAQCCLVKDWRERLRLVKWESFSEIESESGSIERRMSTIRFRQIHNEELSLARQSFEEETLSKIKQANFLWGLQDKLFMDTRSFIKGSEIFPRFSATHEQRDASYQHLFSFPEDKHLGFEKSLTIDISLSPDGASGQSIVLGVRAAYGEEEVFVAKWTEAFTVESASEMVQNAILQTAEKLVPQV